MLIPQALFIQLRKCCNHPYLFPSAEPDFDGSTGEDLVQASGKLAVLDRLLTQLYAGGHRVVLFSQFKMMLDIFEDMLQMRGCASRSSWSDMEWALHESARMW
jgi:SWI/SNF-related matrix-associated actin-dependent regulator of chromatin subfamily A member 5